MRARALVLANRLLLGAAVGVVCGAASALFLWLLDLATTFRGEHRALVYLLPFAGLLLGWAYERFGDRARAGNDLVIDTIHDDGPELPLRMAPLVLLGTVVTHLFGGSAGREGTAVQMGASLTDWLSHRLKVDRAIRLELLASGVAGGFGSVFGTPVAGAVFGMEFVVLGRLDTRALVPALTASVVGDWTTRALGITHAAYVPAPVVDVSPRTLLAAIGFGIVVAFVSTAFVELTHALKRHGARLVPRLPIRAFLGGIAFVLLWRLAGTDDFLGLGVPTIQRAFTDADLPAATFAWKLLFTSITVGSGFIGGEVTPLFFVGATLGNVMSGPLGLPLPLAAGIGLAAVFGTAANTPLALSIMAVELLGIGVLPYVLVTCAVAYLLAGHRGIYASQRVARAKHGAALDHRPKLGEVDR